MPEVIINGPEGPIEARYNHSLQSKAPIALILHPHPEYGGSMNNKVTYALFRTFSDIGFNTLRFNFRGVGKSEGRFGNGEGELADAASVLDWLQSYSPNAPNCWVAGFSFGSWIGMQLLMRRPEINGFISVSPPANNFDFSFLAPCPVSGLITQGDKDNIVTKISVDQLKTKLSAQKNINIDYKIIPGADHFYKGYLNILMYYVRKYLEKRIGYLLKNFSKK
jgi:alpha/beta superfamily hydrolase